MLGAAGSPTAMKVPIRTAASQVSGECLTSAQLQSHRLSLLSRRRSDSTRHGTADKDAKVVGKPGPAVPPGSGNKAPGLAAA